MAKIKYSALIGSGKTVKNTLVLFIPALLAFLANVPPKYAWIAGSIAYFIKNYYEIKQKK